MCEQTVNGQNVEFFALLYRNKTFLLLDFFGGLWYHSSVKLGRFATVPNGFDSVVTASKQGFPAPEKG